MKMLSIGVFAHIDAGKTTLTERLLALTGAIRSAGSVDSGTSASDFLPVERRRGISVRASALTFFYAGVSFTLVDAPGHADFSEETGLALGAVDVGVLVVSASDGVQAQTERLYAAMRRRGLPVLFFLNKCDRADPAAAAAAVRRLQPNLLPFNTPAFERAEDFWENAVEAIGDEALLERYLAGNCKREELLSRLSPLLSRGEICPLVYGSAKTGQGCETLLAVLAEGYDFPRRTDAPFSAFVYQVVRSKTLGKVAHVRVLQGEIHTREETLNARSGTAWKAAQLKRLQGEKYTDAAVLSAGEIGGIVGLSDVRAGDVLGAEEGFSVPAFPPPYLRIKVAPADGGDPAALKAALEELADESPSLALEWASEKRELVVTTAGMVRTEVLKETLLDRFGIRAETSAPSVVYRETPIKAAYGFEAYTMPKPCWAVVKFYIEPLPTGSGFRYESICPETHIAYRYQTHVETCVPRVLREGRLGWQVTDLKVTLVDGEDHPVHTHPLDFFVATPMGIMDGLKNCGTRLLEPVLRVCIRAPEPFFGKIAGELISRRGVLDPPVLDGGLFTLEADVPAAEALDLTERLAMLSGGRAAYDAELKGYFPCPEGMGSARERTSLDPLDRAKWILHARGAL